jgi:hypothetical protein
MRVYRTSGARRGPAVETRADAPVTRDHDGDGSAVTRDHHGDGTGVTRDTLERAPCDSRARAPESSDLGDVGDATATPVTAHEVRS